MSKLVLPMLFLMFTVNPSQGQVPATEPASIAVPEDVFRQVEAMLRELDLTVPEIVEQPELVGLPFSDAVAKVGGRAYIWVPRFDGSAQNMEYDVYAAAYPGSLRTVRYRMTVSNPLFKVESARGIEAIVIDVPAKATYVDDSGRPAGSWEL